MEARQRFDGFDFHNHQVLDQKIQPVADLELQVAIEDRQPDLSANLESSGFQFMDQAMLVGGLKQSRPKGAVNL